MPASTEAEKYEGDVPGGHGEVHRFPSDATVHGSPAAGRAKSAAGRVRRDSPRHPVQQGREQALLRAGSAGPEGHREAPRETRCSVRVDPRDYVYALVT